MNIWWIVLWDQLCFDAYERLGVDFGELPTYTALTWGQSILNIEGTHCYGYLLERKLKQKKDEETSVEASQGKLTVLQMGGRVNQEVILPDDDDEYWKELEKKGRR